MKKKKIMKIKWINAMFILLCMTASCFANDLGVIGEVYPIIEEDFLVFIQNRVATLQHNGGWSDIQDKMKLRAEEQADRPKPVSGLIPTTTERTWHYDPSITVPYDLKDDKGVIFAKAGTRVNPLSILSSKKMLFLYDADDPKQVAWAVNREKECATEKEMQRCQFVLVKGSIKSQATLFSRPVYFDQEGRLVKKFGIQHVPATVQTSGLVLVIREVMS